LITWQISKDDLRNPTDFVLCVLLHYLRLFHPNTYGLLEHDPQRFQGLLHVFAQERGLTLTPEQRLFREEFLHVLDPPVEEDEKPRMPAILQSRKDMLKGDTNALIFFKKAFEHWDPEQLEHLCHVCCITEPAAAPVNTGD
jgi:hypothetical protein